MRLEDIFIVVGEWPAFTIQQAINDMVANGPLAVLIPPSYRGKDSFTNPANVPIIDFRPFGISTGLGGTWATGGGGGNVPNFADAVVPAGTINSINRIFTLTSPPNPTKSLSLFRNGFYQTQGIDYTLSGSTITYISAPITGDSHVASWRF